MSDEMKLMQRNVGSICWKCRTWLSGLDQGPLCFACKKKEDDELETQKKLHEEFAKAAIKEREQLRRRDLFEFIVKTRATTHKLPLKVTEEKVPQDLPDGKRRLVWIQKELPELSDEAYETTRLECEAIITASDRFAKEKE